ncbi:MAG: hypothetical protein HFH84_19310 [Lachnospiraceae bacterium]|nr:hypothetical protein [Lachnospiraceae bacterium]MCI9191685.1 hypothetical protein [Lachnospiraceae bacterium]
MIVKMMPAQYGDCFWVSTNKKFNILIDGGLKTTYTKWIKPLASVKGKTNMFIDLAIVTHIDCDHIGGVIELLLNYTKKQSIGIKEIWHNGLFQITEPKKLVSKYQEVKKDEEILDGIIKRGNLTEEQKNIGVSESFALDVLIQERGIVRNGGNLRDAIYDKTGDYYLNKSTKIVILGPDTESIKALEKYWQKEMIARNYRFQVTDKIKLMQAFEFQMSAVNNYYAPFEVKISGTDLIEKYLSNLDEVDSSVTNCSSICFVIEEGKNKVLFLGDAVICNEGNVIKNIEKRYGTKYHFTAIKLPHHGSRYNVSLDFLRRYTADEYYFSTNSMKFGHPDIDVIADIIYYTSKYDKKLIFNYPLDVVKKFDRSDWKQQYHYEIIVGNGNAVVERRYG